VGPPDDPESARQVLRLAVDLGVTFFDTANAYGPRTVNQLIGQALRPFPEEVIVGNKVDAGRGPDRSWILTGHPDTVRQQVHEALADLRTEVSELTYLEIASHLTDAEITRLTCLADESTAALGQPPRPRTPAR
jgi:pyridoxine 4-dehydrogenase